MMVEQGYDDDFSTAVTITSSCEGLLVPPSHNMVIYATTAGGLSVGALFLAGYLPGALLAISLMVGSYIISVRRNYPKGDKFSLRNLAVQFGKSFWALAAVLIVVFGVVGGVFTRDGIRRYRCSLQLDRKRIHLQRHHLERRMESAGRVYQHPVHRADFDCNLQCIWVLPNDFACAYTGCYCNYQHHG